MNIKAIKLSRVIKMLFIAFVILQPVFDIYMCLFDEYIQIAGTSVATVLRLLMVFAMTVLTMINTRKSKLTLCLVIYAALVVVYTVIHHFNAVGFSVELPLAEYDLFGELLYLIRMCIPPALIYVIWNVKPTYKDIKIMILSVSVIISSVIIVSNLFGFGHVSYVLEKRVIEDNMISWFTGTDVSWILLTCRGLFQWTNQISGVLFIILPFLFYVCFKERKVLFWIFAVMHIIAMINLGTRVATIGGILVFAFMSILHIIEKIIHKEYFKKEIKNLLSVSISALLVTLIFVNSPIIIRNEETPLFDDISIGNNSEATDSQPQNSSSENTSSENTSSGNTSSENTSSGNTSSAVPNVNTEQKENETELSAEEKIAYIESNLPTAQINGIYVYSAYPYTEDYDFWYNIIKNVPVSSRAGNRNMRGYLIDRILERDGRASNYIWGISYTRSSSFVWPERDIETHFDSLGIVGMILFLGPYFLAVIIGIWYFFKTFKDNLRISHCVYLISLGLGIANAYLSGHIMNEIFPSVYLALMAGMTIVYALKPEKEQEVNL